MIELDGLTKTYGDTTAVDDLTFTVRPGVVTGVLGPNGAGKSTTMRLMVGLDRPTSVGEAALAAGAVLHELRVVQTSLEEAYVDMTKGWASCCAAPRPPSPCCSACCSSCPSC